VHSWKFVRFVGFSAAFFFMPPRLPPTEPEICATVRQVYAELDQRPVERDCIRRTECCQFRLTGRTPFLTKAEAILAVRAYRATGRNRLAVPDDGVCPMLERSTGRCLIYADRPFGCRTHFCAAAGGPYSRREVSDLIHRLEDLSRNLGSTDARPLPLAMAEELQNQAARRTPVPQKLPPRARGRG
jgi:Fe-S-cluster containining protein